MLNADDPVARLGAALAPSGRRSASSPSASAQGTRCGPGVTSRALGGIRLDAETPVGPVTLASPLIGEHNVMNLLGAIATGVALGLAPAAIGQSLGAVTTVPGRFERVDAGQDFLVVVDYAHTPDALRRVLERRGRSRGGRLGVVFGAGGDRDRAKRPIMGRIAAELADRVWLTSDNPRSEDPAPSLRKSL